MKNLFLKSILVLGLATTFVACSKDEETTTPAATIVGTWEATSENTKVSLNGTVLQDDTTLYDAGELVVEFKSNGLAVATFDGVDPDTNKYSLNGSVLTLITLDNVDTSVFNTTSFTSSNLIMGMNETQVDGSNTIVSSYKINFKKK